MKSSWVVVQQEGKVLIKPLSNTVETEMEGTQKQGSLGHLTFALACRTLTVGIYEMEHR